MLKRGAWLIGLFVVVACNMDVEDDDHDWDDDDHDKPRKTGPPRSREPAEPGQSDRPGSLAKPPAPNDTGSGGAAAHSDAAQSDADPSDANPLDVLAPSDAGAPDALEPSDASASDGSTRRGRLGTPRS